MLSGCVVLLSAGIVQLLICCAECKPQGSTLVLHDADCKDPPSPLYCLNGNNTCRFCPEPSSGCPEGFFKTSGPSSQCFKIFTLPQRNWTEARQWCIDNRLTLATPNDDVNLGELSQYVSDILMLGVFRDIPWLGGRWSDSTNGFLWEADVGEQPGSSSGRRELDGHPGWDDGEPGSWVGNAYCLGMAPLCGSRPYTSWHCSAERATLCQL